MYACVGRREQGRGTLSAETELRMWGGRAAGSSTRPPFGRLLRCGETQREGAQGGTAPRVDGSGSSSERAKWGSERAEIGKTHRAQTQLNHALTSEKRESGMGGREKTGESGSVVDASKGRRVTESRSRHDFPNLPRTYLIPR
jgi:hypothetical protein